MLSSATAPTLTHIHWVDINAVTVHSCTAAPGLLEPNHLATLHIRTEAERMWRRGDMVKFHCTAHDHNNSMSYIPAELYKRGVGE